MVTINELKLWIKIDTDDDDPTLAHLIEVSRAIINEGIGLMVNEIDEAHQDLYKLAQKLIIAELYQKREGSDSFLNPLTIGILKQLQHTGSDESWK